MTSHNNKSRGRSAFAKYAKPSDLVFAFVLVAIIALMILPLPLFMLDALVAINIAIGVMLILMAIYVNSALQFSAFPSVLLISTLFRLALSVATTRMILLNGDAGNIIDTFGQMVAGGNLVVGLVVFLIITLVQFLVIAKGSERVAEVGARFTLDAMPGKQLSIDSDLRSGIIDKAEARAKRYDLEKESQLHGSLDGAMKFVKGDAIAGIVIIIINLLGGLAVGVFQLNMQAGAAMQKYSILTIGDGLVAQIPALFGAMAAGLIVTRVSESDADSHLGDTIQTQFASMPRVMVVAGLMSFLFALVPGFPSAIFILLGFLLLGLGLFLIPPFRSGVTRLSSEQFSGFMNKHATSGTETDDEAFQIDSHESHSLILELPFAIRDSRLDTSLKNSFAEAVQEHYATSGIAIPDVKFRRQRTDEQTCSLVIYDVPVFSTTISDESQVAATAEELLMALRRNIKSYFGIQETCKLMNEAGERYSDLVKEIQRALPLQTITQILKDLVEEEVSIKNINVIFDALLLASQNEKDPGNLTEYARMSIGRQICFPYSNSNKLKAIGLSIELEERFLNSMRQSSGGSEFSLDPQTLIGLQRAITNACEQNKDFAFVTPVMLRRHIRKIVSDIAFEVPVVSYPEITQPINLDLISRLTLTDALSPANNETNAGTDTNTGTN